MEGKIFCALYLDWNYNIDILTFLQYAPPPSTSDYLSASKITGIQSINDSLLYYGYTFDPTISNAVNKIATQQSKPAIAIE